LYKWNQSKHVISSKPTSLYSKLKLSSRLVNEEGSQLASAGEEKGETVAAIYANIWGTLNMKSSKDMEFLLSDCEVKKREK